MPLNLFGKKNSSGTKLSFSEMLILSLLTVVSIQVISVILSQLFEIPQLKLGFGFILMIDVLAIVAMFGLVKKYASGYTTTKLDAFTLLIVGGMVVLAHIFLPQSVPEIFSVSVNELKSIIGLI